MVVKPLGLYEKILDVITSMTLTNLILFAFKIVFGQLPVKINFEWTNFGCVANDFSATFSCSH